MGTIVTWDVLDGMALFGVGLILAGCVLLASAFVGASRARRADRADDERVAQRPRHVAPPRIQRSALLARTVLLNVVRPTQRGSRLYRSETTDGAGRDNARGIASRDNPREMASRDNAREMASRNNASRDNASRNVAGRNRRDPYRRNPPSPPPPARRLPVSQIVTRENAPVRQPPRQPPRR